MIRRYHTVQDEENYRFWGRVLVTLAVLIPWWVVLLYGVLALARRVGVIQ